MSTFKFFAKGLGVFWLTLLLVMTTYAQAGSTGGAIEGKVKDSTGAVISGATITVKNVETGLSRTATTDDSGNFRIPALDSGSFEVTVEANGFTKLIRRATVQVGQIANIELSLSAGGADEVVQVEATTVVEPGRTQQATTVNTRAIKELPVNGRNFLEFVRLTPGVNTDPRNGDLSFGGLRGTNNSLLIDGSDNNNTFFGQSIGRTGSGRAPYQFSQSAVKEFQVNTNGFAAEFGRAGGGLINVITKSGTNEFHGDANFYYRDRGLNAADAIQKANNRPKPGNHILQFGATLGGPIKKDKLFFFFVYDGQRRSEPVTVIPTNLTLGSTLAQQVITRSGFTNLFDSYPTKFNQDVFLGKIDWQINANNQFSVRYNRQNFTGSNLENGGATSAFSRTGSSNVNTDTVTVSLSTIITQNLINEGRYQFSRDDEPGQANSNVPEVVIGGGQFNFGRNSFSPRFTNERRNQLIENLTWVRKSHTYKFGFDFIRNRIDNFFPGSFTGTYQYSSYQNFVNNVATSFTQAFPGAGTNGPTSFPHSNEYSFFVQDEWNVLPTLKLTYGLRYDSQLKNSPPVPNNDPQLVARGIRTAGFNQDLNNWAPRVGLSWQPFGNSKTVVRAGYGIFYSRTPSIVTGTAHTQNGVTVVNVTFTGAQLPAGLFPNNFSSLPTGVTISRPNLFFFAPDYVDPLVHQASFGVERELFKDWSLGVNYLYVRGTHLTRSRDTNFSDPVVTPVVLRDAGGNQIGTTTALRFGNRPVTNFGRLTQFESTGDSVYHGMTVQANKRFSHHYQLLMAYTWSRAIDNKPDATAVVVGADDAKYIQNSLNIRSDRGLGESDRTHRFVASGVWDLDYTSGIKNGVARSILEGWSLSGILTLQSGFVYSGRIRGDANNDGNNATDRTPFLGRNTFRAPAFYSLDFRVTRSIKVHERVRLELFAEGFNIFNRFNVNTVDVNQFVLTSFTGGIITLTQNPTFRNPINNSTGPRNFQLAARIVF